MGKRLDRKGGKHLNERVKERLDERGSSTIEFLGMIPLVFLVIMIAWQFIAGAHAVILAESAANEAAKV